MCSSDLVVEGMAQSSPPAQPVLGEAVLREPVTKPMGREVLREPARKLATKPTGRAAAAEQGLDPIERTVSAVHRRPMTLWSSIGHRWKAVRRRRDEYCIFHRSR